MVEEVEEEEKPIVISKVLSLLVHKLKALFPDLHIYFISTRPIAVHISPSAASVACATTMNTREVFCEIKLKKHFFPSSSL